MAGRSLARFCLEDLKVAGAHPSLEPTVLKYLHLALLVYLVYWARVSKVSPGAEAAGKGAM